MSEKERIDFNRVIQKFAEQIPANIDENEVFEQIQEMINLTKIKGLTVRQAQLLFQICSEYILDSTLV